MRSHFEDGLLRPHKGEFDESKIYYGGNAKLFKNKLDLRRRSSM